MELELRNRFIEKYDELVIWSLDSDPKLNIEEIQILVLDILDWRKNISWDKKIIKFISESLNNNLPINWLTWEILFNIFWEEFVYNDLDKEEKENMQKEQFVSEYRYALFNSKLHNSKEDVIELYASIFLWNEIDNNVDSLAIFISKALDMNLPINWITWDLLTEAYSIMIPWVKTYKQSFVIPDFDLNVMNWTYFAYWDKMLVFNEWKMIFCDISLCDKAYIKKHNDLAIKRCMPQINVNYNTSKRFLELVINECSNYINNKEIN